MDRLNLVGVQGGNILEYSFAFTETDAISSACTKPEYSASEGESLWDYVNLSGGAIDELVKVNPHIRNINYLEKGERVYMP